ncbi:MAG: hypothetical protein IT306_09100 [Chloroflexi bacterium]|nr:hypothetical protein [Chloroflexota bacterium]
MISSGQPAPLASQTVVAAPDAERAAEPAVDAPADPAAPTDARASSGGRLATVWEVLRRWESSFALLLISTVYSLIQGATQNIIGVDGYYHVKVAALMWEQGWRLLAPLDFPWLQLTILGPGRYTDHHFLFHVLQAPFTVGDLRVGAKMAAVLFAVLGLYTTYHFLSRFGVRYPGLWIAVLIACAPIFLWRQSMARTQSLSLLLIVLGLWALFSGRSRWLLPVGFLAAWLFNGFFFVLGAPAGAVAVSVGCWLARRWWLREAADAEGATARLSPPLSFALAALGWTLLGLAIGLLTHPYFPRNVEFAFFHLLPKAVPAEAGEVAVGQEWAPYSFNGFVVRVGPTMALTLLGLLPLVLTLWRRQWPEWRALVLAILAVGFLAMVAASQRIIEYYPAISVIFCAWSLSHAGGPLWEVLGRFWRALRARTPAATERIGGLAWRLRRAAPVLAFAVLLPFIISSIGVAGRQASTGLAWNTYRDGALWLARNTPAQAWVFTTGWDDFPHMFFWNTHNYYLIGLDPTYMSLEDPEGYTLWRSVTQGRVPNPSKTIRERFNSEWVLTDLEHRGFLRVAAQDPGLEEVFRSSTVVVYHVRGD